jgi:hypothetical protein
VGAAGVKGPSLADQLSAALVEIDSLRAENARLRGLLGLDVERDPDPPASWEPTLFAPTASVPMPAVDRRSSPAEKVELFRRLFSGRDDVYALRW